MRLDRALNGATSILFAGLAGIGSFAQLTAQDNPRAAEFFTEQIQPIVFKSCNGCHTYGGHAGGLRMDSYTSFMQGGDLGPVLAAGDPQASLIMKAVSRVDPSFSIPPMRPLSRGDGGGIEKFILILGGANPADIPKTASVTIAPPPPPVPIAAPAPTPAPAPVASKPAPAEEARATPVK